MKVEYNKDNNSVFENELYRVVVKEVPMVAGDRDLTGLGYVVTNIVTNVEEFTTSSLPEAISTAEQGAAWIEADMHKMFRKTNIQPTAGSGMTDAILRGDKPTH